MKSETWKKGHVRAREAIRGIDCKPRKPRMATTTRVQELRRDPLPQASEGTWGG